MNPRCVHQPPPGPVLAELVRAGLSLSTAMAMELWKAHEVLDLLRVGNRGEPVGPPGTMRGTI